MRSTCNACNLKAAGALSADMIRKLQAEKPPLSGIFNVNKPAGMTSHDVVQTIRKASGQRRVGHAGTLDPMATGVLLVCVGTATRVTEYLMDHAKSYRAEVTLGVTTDTHDAEGAILRTVDAGHISRIDVETALERSTGVIEQVPPMYSALKKGGKKLYELARDGISVEREPRQVEITRLEVVDWTPPKFTVDIDCSRGTYIRALARDLGEALGVGAHLSGLTRMASGHFRIEDATDLETVVEALKNDWWMLLIHPLDEALLDFEAIIVDKETENKIQHGQMVDASHPISTPYARAYSHDGRLIAIMRYEPWAQRWQPNKVFPKAG